MYGFGYLVSFQTPDESIAFDELSVRFVPPAARTHGEVAGQDVDFCLSKL